jgi:hypothetical protein
VWGSLLAVLNSYFHPPTLLKIHTNKHQNLVNRVYTNEFHEFLVSWSFAGYTLGIHQKRVKVRNQENVNAYSTQTNRRKARLPFKPRPQTHRGGVQAQHATAMRKAVVGRQHLDVAAPDTPACTDCLLLPRGVSWWLPQGGCMRIPQIFHLQPTIPLQ